MIKSSLSRVVLGASSILGLLVGTTLPAAACDQWLAPAQMVVIQGNGPYIGFSVIQEGTKIHGFAKYYTNKRTIIGNYSGTIVGDVFYARVLWTYSGVSAIGVYRGKIQPHYGVSDPKGYIFEGTTYDEYNSGSGLVGWNAYHFTCQPVVSQAPAPPPPDFKEKIDKRKHDAINAAFETAATESASADRAMAAALQSPAPLAFGRVQPRAETPAGPPTTMCEKAAAAREANRPTAAALQQRCDAERAAQPSVVPEPAAQPPADPIPTTLPPAGA